MTNLRGVTCEQKSMCKKSIYKLKVWNVSPFPDDFNMTHTVYVILYAALVHKACIKLSMVY